METLVFQLEDHVHVYSYVGKAGVEMGRFYSDWYLLRVGIEWKFIQALQKLK